MVEAIFPHWRLAQDSCILAESGRNSWPLASAGKARYRLQSCCTHFSRALVASIAKLAQPNLLGERNQSGDSSERNRNSRSLPSMSAGPKGLSSPRLVHERPIVRCKQIRDGILPRQFSFDSSPSELAHSFSLVWIV